MLNVENMLDANQRRLAWRCRRGMLELDIVLQRFVANHFKGLNLAEMQAFDEMLELPDNDFWALLSTPNAANHSKNMRTVLAKITGQQE